MNFLAIALLGFGIISTMISLRAKTLKGAYWGFAVSGAIILIGLLIFKK